MGSAARGKYQQLGPEDGEEEEEEEDGEGGLSTSSRRQLARRVELTVATRGKQALDWLDEEDEG